MGDQGSRRCVERDDDLHVSDEPIESVRQTVEPVNGSVPADLSSQLRAVAVQYPIDLSLEPYWGASERDWLA